MAAFDEYYGDFPEVECEFCRVSFPLELINEHEVMVHALEMEQFQPQENLPESTYTDIQSEPLVETKPIVQKANVTDKPKQVNENYQTKGNSENKLANETLYYLVEQSQDEISESCQKRKIEDMSIWRKIKMQKQQDQLPEQNQPVINLTLEREQFEKYVEKLDINNGKGERLLAYGPGMNPEKGMDDEKEIYKMPENLLKDKKEKKDDVIDINDLSDDECNESLEEFWKRAQDALKYQRNKQKSELMMPS